MLVFCFLHCLTRRFKFVFVHAQPPSYYILFFLTYCTNALAAPNDLTPVEQLDKYTDDWASSPAVMKIHIEHPQRSNGFCARLSTCCGLGLVFCFLSLSAVKVDEDSLAFRAYPKRLLELPTVYRM